MNRVITTTFVVSLLLLLPAALADAAVATATADDVRQWLESEDTLLLVDVRSSHRFDFKHIRGAINVPAFAIGSKALPDAKRIVVYDDGLGSGESERAADQLIRNGAADVWILDGGLTAWDASKNPVVVQTGILQRPFTEPISSDDLDRLIGAGRPLAIFDLRSPAEFSRGRVPSSRNASDRAQLNARTAGMKPNDVIVLYDDGSGVAEKRAEELRRNGFRAVRYLYGGMPAWTQKGLRTEK